MAVKGGPLQIGVLVSGSGTNLQAIIDAIERGSLEARIALVVSDVKDAPAIARAERHGIPWRHVDPQAFGSREEFDREVVRLLVDAHVELVALAGFMRVLTPYFIRSYPQRILNIHPALLPSFKGLRAQKKALDYRVRFSGCTVHIVDEGVDTGPIVIQAVVPVLPQDTEESLAARILHEEHRIYPQAIQWYAEGRVTVEGRRVIVKGAGRPDEVVSFNPPLELEAS